MRWAMSGPALVLEIDLPNRKQEYCGDAWVPAKQLRASFVVTGHFYPGGRRTPGGLRSELEIRARRQGREVVGDPEVIVIMMNPGASCPAQNRLDRGDVWKTGNEKSRIAAVPDTTQYQVMRVMRAMNWSTAKVLNLSDLRCGKSTEFEMMLARYGDWIEHSIFCPKRKAELSVALGAAKTPVLCAWGTSARLGHLAKRAVHAIDDRIRFGLSKPDNLDGCYHPLARSTPYQKAWVNLVVRDIKQQQAKLSNTAASASE